MFTLLKRFSSSLFVLLLAGVLVVSAAAPSGGYTPAATLDPDCLPGATDCFVKNLIPTGGTAGQVLTTNGSGVYSWTTALTPTTGWTVNGNSGTNPTTNFIGTTDAQDLVVKTNNTERMRVLANGRFGIGTSNPTSFVDISDPVNANTSLKINSSGGGSFLTLQNNTASNNNNFLTLAGPSGNFTMYTWSDMSNLAFYSSALGSEVVRMWNDGSMTVAKQISTGSATGNNTFAGNVRIGNSGTANNKLEITHGTAGNSGLRFTNLLSAPLLATNATGDVISATSNPANGLFWGITGNSGTTAGTNFIGTTDAQDLVIKTNNIEKARVLSAVNASNQIMTITGGDAVINDVIIGRGSGNDIFNTITGNGALIANTVSGGNNGKYNSAFGYFSLNANTTGFLNSAFGYKSLQVNTTGRANTGFGAETLRSNTTGLKNTAIGNASMYSMTTGSYNTAMGSESLYNNTTGSNNVAIGVQAHDTSGALSTSSNDVAVGF